MARTYAISLASGSPLPFTWYYLYQLSDKVLATRRSPADLGWGARLSGLMDSRAASYIALVRTKRDGQFVTGRPCEARVVSGDEPRDEELSVEVDDA